MLARRSVRLSAVGLAALAAACASGATGRSDDMPAEVTRDGGALVLTGSALSDGPGSLLSAMTGKVPNLRVQRHDGQCPEIALRTHVTYRGFVNPFIYVDGARITDTCILESLRADDVDRVEVYPQGVTSRPGYAMHAHGLILVFLRSAS